MEDTPKAIVPISIAPEVRRAECAANAARIQASILAYRLRLIKGRVVLNAFPRGVP